MSKDNLVSFPKDAKIFKDSDICNKIDAISESAFYKIIDLLDSEHAKGKDIEEIIYSVYNGVGKLSTFLFYEIAKTIAKNKSEINDVAHHICDTFAEQLKAAMQQRINSINTHANNECGCEHE